MAVKIKLKLIKNTCFGKKSESFDVHSDMQQVLMVKENSIKVVPLK